LCHQLKGGGLEIFMKKEIRLMLDYQCYPIWIYDDKGNYIDNDYVQEIKTDNNLVALLEKLQNSYDSLYLNTNKEFKYVGFNSNNERQEFEEMVSKIYNILVILLSDKYLIKNMIDVSKM